MNYFDKLKRAIQHEEKGLGILTTDYKYYANTTYENQSSTNSYTNPKKFIGVNPLSLTISDINITFPVEPPMQGYSTLHDKFCYQNGKWGIERYFRMITYDGTENWFKSADCTFAIDNPPGIAPTSTDSHYRWIDSTITNSHHSFASVYKYDNSIAVGTQYIAIRIDSTVTTVEDFKNILVNLNDSGTPLTVFYQLDDPVFEPLPTATQKYLRGFM